MNYDVDRRIGCALLMALVDTCPVKMYGVRDSKLRVLVLTFLTL